MTPKFNKVSIKKSNIFASLGNTNRSAEKEMNIQEIVNNKSLILLQVASNRSDERSSQASMREGLFDLDTSIQSISVEKRQPKTIVNTPIYQKVLSTYQNGADFTKNLERLDLNRSVDMVQRDISHFQDNFPMQNHSYLNKIHMQRIRNSQTTTKPVKIKPHYLNDIECNDKMKSLRNKIRYQKNFHQNFLKKISHVKFPPIVSINGRKIYEPPIVDVSIPTQMSLSRSKSSKIDV